MSFIILMQQSSGTGFCATPPLNPGSKRTGVIRPADVSHILASARRRRHSCERDANGVAVIDDFSLRRGDTRSSGWGSRDRELDGVQGDFVIQRSRVHHRSWELLCRSRESEHPVAENGHCSRRTLPKKRHKTGAS